jgi:hypothetical protein
MCGLPATMEYVWLVTCLQVLILDMGQLAIFISDQVCGTDSQTEYWTC